MKCYVAERDRITSNNAIELPVEYRRVFDQRTFDGTASIPLTSRGVDLLQS